MIGGCSPSQRYLAAVHILHTCAYSIARLEMLDEIEELDLVLSHYVISWAVKVPLEGEYDAYRGWGLVREEEDIIRE